MNNGIDIPQIGYGVWQVPKELAKKCVLDALEVGYRHIDTAYAYQNEKEVGEAIRESGLKREDIFVTTKIFGGKSYKDGCIMIERALKTLGLAYIDLMLIHWPEGDNVGMYKAMEDYYEKGKLRAIGLSNFYGDELDNILKNARIMPALNQIETHVYKNQKEMQKTLEKHGILLESWSPLASAKHNIFNDQIMVNIANKHNKTVAQVALRYLYERNIVIIPKTIHKERMKENLDILDFNLDREDIELIETLNEDKSIFQM